MTFDPFLPWISAHAAGRPPGRAGPGLPGPPSTAGTTMTAAPTAATLPAAARVIRRRRRRRPARRLAVATGPTGGSAAKAAARSLRTAVSSILCRLRVTRGTARRRDPGFRFGRGQSRPQLVECARALALDVPRRAAEHLGGLIDAHVLPVPQRDDGPRPGRQRRQRAERQQPILRAGVLRGPVGHAGGQHLLDPPQPPI